MKFTYHYKGTDTAELDVTSFMNLMIVLVPVLLLSMSFTQIKVYEVQIPDLTGGSENTGDSQSNLELIIKDKGFSVFYPAGKLIKDVPKRDSAYDFDTLSEVMKAVKGQLDDRRDILILSEKDTEYQTLISTMEAVKSYQTVVAASLVEIELFPNVSLGEHKK